MDVNGVQGGDASHAVSLCLRLLFYSELRLIGISDSLQSRHSRERA